ncbi:hypothetical protein FQR65_LT16223 [Abscondita terminalis]|nr:hypothetical protein FQR65_LT16223 [Abscondita terminalis]
MRVGGPYRIEVTAPGKKPMVYEDVYLELGEPFVLNPVIEEKTNEIKEVVLAGSRSGNINKTGAATNIGLKQIQELPQSSRSITEFTRLTPQANGNSFAGRDARYNNLQIDGANFNNGFGLSGSPIPGGSHSLFRLMPFEEISVNIAPFDITQSGFIRSCLTPNTAIDKLELLDINGKPRTYSSGEWPKSRIMLSPRFGFNYDIFGNRSFIIRGGTGIFSGKVPFVWLTNMPTGAGVLQNTIEPGSYNQVAPWIGNYPFQSSGHLLLHKEPTAGGENVL